jgi:hypothetical protein
MKRNTSHTALARAAECLIFTAAIAAVLVVATPALAANPRFDPWTISGPLYNVGDEPQATGTGAVRSWVAVIDPRNQTTIRRLDLTLSCTKLTPGATYVWRFETAAGAGQLGFVANAKGKSGLLSTGFNRFGPGPRIPLFPLLFEVYRVDGDDLVLVLSSDP